MVAPIAGTPKKRKIVKIIKKRRDSSASTISILSRRNSSFDMDDDETKEINDLLTDSGTPIQEILLKSNEKVDPNVATLAKLQKPTDYKPPKAQPLDLAGLHFIVHRLPDSKQATCGVLHLVLSSVHAFFFPFSPCCCCLCCCALDTAIGQCLCASAVFLPSQICHVSHNDWLQRKLTRKQLSALIFVTSSDTGLCAAQSLQGRRAVS